MDRNKRIPKWIKKAASMDKKAEVKKKAGTELWQTPEGEWYLLGTVMMKPISETFKTKSEAVAEAIRQNRWTEEAGERALAAEPDGIGDPSEFKTADKKAGKGYNDTFVAYGNKIEPQTPQQLGVDPVGLASSTGKVGYEPRFTLNAKDGELIIQFGHYFGGGSYYYKTILETTDGLNLYGGDNSGESWITKEEMDGLRSWMVKNEAAIKTALEKMVAGKEVEKEAANRPYSKGTKVNVKDWEKSEGDIYTYETPCDNCNKAHPFGKSCPNCKDMGKEKKTKLGPIVIKQTASKDFKVGDWVKVDYSEFKENTYDSEVGQIISIDLNDRTAQVDFPDGSDKVSFDKMTLTETKEAKIDMKKFADLLADEYGYQGATLESLDGVKRGDIVIYKSTGQRAEVLAVDKTTGVIIIKVVGGKESEAKLEDIETIKLVLAVGDFVDVAFSDGRSTEGEIISRDDIKKTYTVAGIDGKNVVIEVGKDEITKEEEENEGASDIPTFTDADVAMKFFNEVEAGGESGVGKIDGKYIMTIYGGPGSSAKNEVYSFNAEDFLTYINTDFPKFIQRLIEQEGEEFLAVLNKAIANIGKGTGKGKGYSKQDIKQYVDYAVKELKDAGLEIPDNKEAKVEKKAEDDFYVSSQVGSVMYVMTKGFKALYDADTEAGEDFMQQASNRIKGETDMAIGKPEAVKVEYQDGKRTAVVPTKLPEKVYAIVNETGGLTYMLPEEY